LEYYALFPNEGERERERERVKFDSSGRQLVVVAVVFMADGEGWEPLRNQQCRAHDGDV
jgi:hypothetical protein